MKKIIDDFDWSGFVRPFQSLPTDTLSIVILFLLMIVHLPTGMSYLDPNLIVEAHFAVQTVFLYWMAVKLIRVLGRALDSANPGIPLPNSSLRHATHEGSCIVDQERFTRVSVHEAGHILGLKGFDKFPEHTSAWISTTLKDRETGGRVTYQPSSHDYNDPTYIAKCRTFSLLGFAAEKEVYGQAYCGADLDLKNWERLAKLELKNFPTDLDWFREPINEGEFRVNAKTLRSMLGEELQAAEKITKKEIEFIHKAASLL